MNSRTSSALAALLLIGSVTAELLWPDLGESRLGEVTLPAVNAVGWLLVLATLRQLPPSGGGRRAALGRWTTRFGALLQVFFGISYAVSAAILGEPVEAAFVLFALGFLLLLVGGVALGGVFWRRGDRLVGVGFRAVALLGLLAIAVAVDPWHDIALLSSYSAWVLVGAGAASARENASTEAEAMVA